ncbi:hypothetical protein AOQ84DRAFT_226016 [Glonium stellatum]|uniref:Nephrocystin 3-like N-terminal domain-containing protein n=1 Tax=Glonium stellatum TaxID=574774 RepID=A0A8E2JPK9_9PEZI|nr:hypothetical protein AOQ84DRAFT_226016 [Glonium stellatum]
MEYRMLSMTLVFGFLATQITNAGQLAKVKHTHTERSAMEYRQKLHRIATASFFFHARGASIETQSLGLFLSLLHQLFQQIPLIRSDFLPHFRKKHDTKKGGWVWHLAEIRQHFLSAIHQAKGYWIIIFIDALDECNEHEVRSIAEFFDNLTVNTNSPDKCRLKVCLSSRYYPNIRIKGCLEIRMEQCNAADISTFVHTRMRWIDNDELGISQPIIAKASGVFLWVVLVAEKLLTALDDGETRYNLLSILESIPSGLTELFTQAMASIPAGDRRDTALVMLWVLLSERPLTPTEMRYALAFSQPHESLEECEKSPKFIRSDEEFEKLLRKRSRGLVEISEKDWDGHTKVQFIHESVRTFLAKEKGLDVIAPSLGKPLVGTGHNLLKEACLNYLKIKELAVVEPVNLPRILSQPFGKYAIFTILRHAAKAENEGLAQSDLMNHFPGTHNSLSSQYCKPLMLSVACSFGLITWFQALLDHGADINAKNELGETVLHLAAELGNNTMLELAIRHGANIHAGDEFGRTALDYASESCSKMMIESHMKHGADIHTGNEDEDEDRGRQCS